MSNTLIRSFNLPNGKVAFGMSIPCKGNGVTLGLTDGTNNSSLVAQVHDYGLIKAFNGQYGTNPKPAISGTGLQLTGSLGVTTDPKKSGVVTDLSDGQLVVIKY